MTKTTERAQKNPGEPGQRSTVMVEPNLLIFLYLFGSFCGLRSFCGVCSLGRFGCFGSLGGLRSFCGLSLTRPFYLLTTPLVERRRCPNRGEAKDEDKRKNQHTNQSFHKYLGCVVADIRDVSIAGKKKGRQADFGGRAL